ncbi:MAG: PKD domain-containing protein [Saprospiraceae bacterium]|nr:PKD domain-containing protein [Saprospiraceae bacterium]
MKNLFRNSAILLLAAMLGLIVSCKKDKDPTPVSGFTYTIDATDFRTVHFTSTATDAEELYWNFGDVTTLSTEANPSHTYAGAGEYNVSLTASGKDGKNPDIQTQKITLVDPDAQLTALAGNDTKGWKLLRIVNDNTWPLEVGPIDRSSVWWAMGRGNDDIANRPCTMNDEFIFGRDGSYTYDSNGDFWAEGGVFLDPNSCKPSDAANLIGFDGSDYAAFGDGTHSYTLAATSLTVEGLGAFIGLQKIGTDAEVFAPQTSITYDIIKLDDSGPVDTLILESKYKQTGQTADNAYWKMVLVHYDNPAEEPPIPGPKPVAGFTFTSDVLTVTFTNTSTGADSYSWDFGDGSTATEANPVHTYASSGLYTVVLTATNANGIATSQQDLTVAAPLTEAELIGGAWKVRHAANSIFVGPGLGLFDWYIIPLAHLDGTDPDPTNNWSCIVNDEFIFTAGGGYQYKTNGDARNDGYFGTPNGCWTDAEVAASPGAAFGSGVHSFAFTPASASPSGRPIITLTNGASGAAFIGFYKGYYGGENGSNANPPNGGNATNQYEVMGYLNDGTTETLTISVDISGAHDGSAAWSVVLVR